MTDRLRREQWPLMSRACAALDMTQAEFARAYRFSVGAVRIWSRAARAIRTGSRVVGVDREGSEFVRAALAKGTD